MTNRQIETIVNQILAGHDLTSHEANKLLETSDKESLYSAANQVRQHFFSNKVDTCSIINARSGKCSEDCKWCAQSKFHHVNLETYDLVDEKSVMREAKNNADKGVNHFSMVTSGRAISNHHLRKLCDYFKKIDQAYPIHLCASMGLLNREQLQMLQEAGVNRYHCNLETAPSLFPTLVSTHSLAEKIKTIRTAQSLGMKICSGGIIGMGESMQQRLELAFMLRDLKVDSIPMNILMPIKGTPLSDAKPLSDEEILTTFALFRLINPKAQLRITGGRNLITKIQDKALSSGVSACMVGDYLTTNGTNIQQDFENFKRLGLTIPSDKKEPLAFSNRKEMSTEDLLEYDKEHLWHPYTSTINPLPVYPVKRASGCTIELETGEKLIDGMSSWWAAVHGYNNPILNEAAQSQIHDMSHVMFGGFTHQPAVQLAKLLVELTPDKLQKVFFADSGSVAVEVALKMAIQYQRSLNNKKIKFATIRNGYHGDTWHAMSVCDPVTGMHQVFNGALPIHYFLPQPEGRFGEQSTEKELSNLERFFEEKHSELAAFILEPIVQGAGGMWFYSTDYLKKVRELCDKYGVLLIADEIATGFGRTGELFASNYANVTPDIMCVGKALTGGYMTLSAVLATNDVADTISKGEAGVFMHGPTFMGNPLACSVALASLHVLINTNWKTRVSHINQILNEQLKQCQNFETVADVRCLGAIGVVELKSAVDMGKIQKQFVEAGVWVRPFGKLVYLMPPFIIRDDELLKLCEAVVCVVRDFSNNH